MVQALQRYRRTWFFVVIVGGWLLLVRPAAALDVTVTATVGSVGPPPNPIVQFQGLASPSAVIAISRDSANVHNGAAGSNAVFDITLAEQPTGQHVYELTATDSNGSVQSTATFALNLSAGGTTTVSDIFFGPSIGLGSAAVTQGTNIVASGRTTLNATVTLTVTGPTPAVLTGQSGNTGNWSITIPTSAAASGNYSVSARAATNSLTSDQSRTLSFSVAAAPVPTPQPTPEPEPTPEQPPPAPTPEPPPPPTPTLPNADFNGDGRVDLIDFSILLFYWGRSSLVTDLNRDGRVNIPDFSILLFQWTG